MLSLKYSTFLLFHVCTSSNMTHVNRQELKEIFKNHNCCEKECMIPRDAFLAKRDHDICPGDLIWNECGSACERSCDTDPHQACILLCVPKCECPMSTVLEKTDSTTCIDRRDCTTSKTCEYDRDCDTGFWCRVKPRNHISTSVNTEKHCVPFMAEGESCNGYTLPEYFERCSTEFSCEARGHPLLVDAPGICTNRVKNCLVTFTFNQKEYSRNYSIGESFQGLGDNYCNQCICMDTNGETDVACTRKYCTPRDESEPT